MRILQSACLLMLALLLAACSGDEIEKLTQANSDLTQTNNKLNDQVKNLESELKAAQEELTASEENISGVQEQLSSSQEQIKTHEQSHKNTAGRRYSIYSPCYSAGSFLILYSKLNQYRGHHTHAYKRGHEEYK